MKTIKKELQEIEDTIDEYNRGLVRMRNKLEENSFKWNILIRQVKEEEERRGASGEPTVVRF